MARRLFINFNLLAESSDQNSIVPRMRDFGEDLFREFQRSGLAEIDLNEVDRATNQLCLSAIKSRKLKTVRSIVQKKLEKEGLDNCASLVEQ